MNELFVVCFFYWVRTTFLCLILMFLMNALPTDRQTDRPTDTAYYRDARTHLKNIVIVIVILQFCKRPGRELEEIQQVNKHCEQQQKFHKCLESIAKGYEKKMNSGGGRNRGKIHTTSEWHNSRDARVPPKNDQGWLVSDLRLLVGFMESG